MTIDLIKISGFKSVVNLELRDVTPFSVFAGPNGAGKSNIADALDFVRTVIDSGASKAISKFGGYPHIHCVKVKKEKARTFSFAIETAMGHSMANYAISIHSIDGAPSIKEKLSIAGNPVLSRQNGSPPEIQFNGETSPIMQFPVDHSALILVGGQGLLGYMSNIRVFRFDPFGAKEPDSSGADSSELDPRGLNLATMLAVLEKDPAIRTQIGEWLDLLVPGMKKVTTERQRLDGRTVITFKEEGVRALFPANLISDGTVYALCIMTAVLSRSARKGITIIEEPERGIHPKAVTELVSLMRECATVDHPVFVTTHSESVVRAAKPEELWLVNKTDGRTIAKNAALHCGDLKGTPLDKAWLMNFFDGGLPW